LTCSKDSSRCKVDLQQGLTREARVLPAARIQAGSGRLTSSKDSARRREVDLQQGLFREAGG